MAGMTTVPSGNPGAHMANGSAGASLGGAASGGGKPGRKQPLPLPHIDDITSVTIDFDRYTPMDKLLTIAEDLLREAETYRAFGGRIDMAMKSYIKANILLVDVVKKNKGWASLQADNKAQRQRYNALVRQAQAGHGVFEHIKSEIKADNARSGVKPTVHRTQHAGVASAARAAPRDGRLPLEDGGNSDEIPTPSSSPGPSTDKPPVHLATESPTTHAKAKPSVRPKPDALHGNAIHPSGVAARTAAEDLNKRFANLRPPRSASQPSLVQDPRIRTQPIVVPPTAQRRDAAVSAGRSSLQLETHSFELPKMPGAIYKPARGTVSTEAAELPSSSSRRFSLARSLTSGSVNSTSVRTPLAGPGEESNDWSQRTKLAIPEGETLSVAELVRLMKEGSKSVSILLIDIRSREAFDEGHIMSQATICIEPEVLTRKNISASEIAESMVLAPSAEQVNFERRHGFDLIVFYDQDSTRIGTKQGNPDGAAVQGLYNALTYFDFAGDTSPKPPKLLEGGLDAWTSMMGSSSLVTTETSVGRPLMSPTNARRSMYTAARRKSHVSRPIQDPDEARRWEQSTNDPDTFKPAQNVEDFFRRIPPTSEVKESMVSAPGTGTVDGHRSLLPPMLSPPGIRTADGHYSGSPPHIPAEPARPAPTVARTSFSGFNGEDGRIEAKKLVPRSKGHRKGRQLVGLRNPQYFCYANSSLQAMFWTEGFADDLFTGRWARDYKVPMKGGEKIPNPQLLAKMLAQLFAWMEKALIHPMEARTLMQYMQHISSRDLSGKRKDRSQIFGRTDIQHDAQEFFSYVIANLHDETNIYRDQEEKLDEISSSDAQSLSLFHNSIRYWHQYATKHDSIVTKYWRGMETNIAICRRCQNRSITCQASDITFCPIVPGKATLHASLSQFISPDHVSEYNCDGQCQKNGWGKSDADKTLYFSRLPDRLTFQIGRGSMDESTFNPAKNTSRYTFPLRDLDMEPYFIPPSERRVDRADAKVAETADTDHHFRPPFKYDCYAVICHIGATLKSGHYVAYVRDPESADPTDWIKFNDTVVTRVKVGSSLPDETEKLFGDRNQQAYLLFYQRKA